MGVGKPFQPGQSGNPGGQRRVTREARRLAQDESPESIRALARIRDDETQDVHARVAACKFIVEQGCGKAKQQIEKTVTHVRKTPREYTLAELEQLARGAEDGTSEPH